METAVRILNFSKDSLQLMRLKLIIALGQSFSKTAPRVRSMGTAECSCSFYITIKLNAKIMFQ